MTRTIIKHPSREMLDKWGILAHVDDRERQRILDVPHGQFRGEIARLTKEVDIVKFPRRKKTGWEERWYNPKVKQLTKQEPSHEDTAPDDTEHF